MQIQAELTREDNPEIEYKLIFRTRQEYDMYFTGLKNYAERVPGKYRRDLVDIMIRMDSQAKPLDMHGEGVATVLNNDDAMTFFRLTTSCVAVLNYTDDLQDIFSDRLRTIRHALGMNQKDFSMFVGIPQLTISAYESGRNKPSIDVLRLVAEKCNVTTDWLCGKDYRQNPD